jgi:hypothetical protein
MASASLYLPLVNWHHYTHSTTTTTLLHSHPYVFAGQQDGHIWVYTCDKEGHALKVEKRNGKRYCMSIHLAFLYLAQVYVDRS